MIHNKCVGIFGYLFGHKIVHIYNIEKKDSEKDLKLDELSIENIIQASKLIKETYVKSYCERCGKSIEEIQDGNKHNKR